MNNNSVARTQKRGAQPVQPRHQHIARVAISVAAISMALIAAAASFNIAHAQAAPITSTPQHQLSETPITFHFDIESQAPTPTPEELTPTESPPIPPLKQLSDPFSQLGNTTRDLRLMDLGLIIVIGLLGGWFAYYLAMSDRRVQKRRSKTKAEKPKTAVALAETETPSKGKPLVPAPTIVKNEKKQDTTTTKQESTTTTEDSSKSDQVKPSETHEVESDELVTPEVESPAKVQAVPGDSGSAAPVSKGKEDTPVASTSSDLPAELVGLVESAEAQAAKSKGAKPAKKRWWSRKKKTKQKEDDGDMGPVYRGRTTN